LAAIKHIKLRKLVYHPKPATHVNTGPTVMTMFVSLWFNYRRQ